MNEHDITLKEAHHRNQQVGGVVTGDGIKTGANDWQAVGDGFLAAEGDLEVDDDIDSSLVISFQPLLDHSKTQSQRGRFEDYLMNEM